MAADRSTVAHGLTPRGELMLIRRNGDNGEDILELRVNGVFVMDSQLGSFDAIVLDVDNGPGYLVNADNAQVYEARFLTACLDRLDRDGALAIWSSSPSPELAAILHEVAGGCATVQLAVTLGSRAEEYVVYVATPRPPGRVTSTNVAVMSEQSRVERDTMGEVDVPAHALWRAQTQRAVENFPISGTRLEGQQIRALALVKQAAAKVNVELGVLSDEIGKAIEEAAAAVAAGGYDDQFPIDVFQTGSGTSSNMNANEVIATLATRRLGSEVHPNDHVNASQSSNDVFPTSIHVATTSAIARDLIPALEHLAASLTKKSEEFTNIVKSGRTHLMDATPVTLGQEFGGYAAIVGMGVERLRASLPRTAELPLGGTAVGTGINTPPGFAARVIEVLTDLTGIPLTEARNHFEAQGNRDGLVEASGQLRAIAVGLHKICTDLRWMSSGPRAGLGEIQLPDLQPGSSIMPGKVNPVLPEATAMVCAQVIGNDATIAFAGASGNFELNVMLPVMARNVLESIRLLANAARILADRCIDGITADEEQCRRLAESSPSIVTSLNRFIGYENAAAVAKRSMTERKTIRDVILDEGYVERGDLSMEQLDQALDVLSMTRPPRS